MLDIKRIRNNPEEIIEALKKRRGEYPIQKLLDTDEKRREVIQKVESMKAEQNKLSKQVPQMKKNGEDTTELFKNLKKLSDDIKSMDDDLKNIDEEIREYLMEIPNTPNKDVPVGLDDTENLEMRKWGEPRKFDFDIKAHWDLGVDLDILDFERATKISKSRFSVFKGKGARLERALMNFMVDLHTDKQGYTEMNTPVLMSPSAMMGTGQIPKFKEDMFYCEKDDMYLAPTAEVPVTNLLGGEILEQGSLPIYYTAFTQCFRREAGSAGRDTRGLIRNHQFEKVEMVKFVEPATSYDELEKLTNNAEEILQLLEIPYRVVRPVSYTHLTLPTILLV